VSQRGTTLVELLVASAIAVLAAVAFFSLSQGARAFSMRSATAQFDAALSYAQALASTSGNGATMVFARRLGPDGAPMPGFVLALYAGRPTGANALQPAPMPPLQSPGDLAEARLGDVPFTIFLDGAGHASGMTGTVGSGTVISTDPGCPPGETGIVLRFSDSRAVDTRSVPCDSPLAGSPQAVPTALP
jgi:type II secretory pathway pseudopilin PulG